VQRVAGRVSGVPTLRDSRPPADSIDSNFDAGETPEEIANMYEVPIAGFRSIQLAESGSKGFERIMLSFSLY
jgi:hypothetical protein